MINTSAKEKKNVTVTTNAGHTDQYSGVIFSINGPMAQVTMASGKVIYYPLSSVERIVVGGMN